MLPIVILLFAATLFLGEDSPLNVRSVAGGAVVFIAVVSILSLMVPVTSRSFVLVASRTVTTTLLVLAPMSEAVRAEEYGERRWVRFEFRGNVRARQLGEAHFHVGVVGDGALAVRHGHFAVFDEDDFRCRFRQDFGEQVGFAASCHFVVDVSLGEWQERQGLRQCQW